MHQVVEELRDEIAWNCESGIFVVELAAVSEMLDEGVDEHIPRAGVEGEDVGRFCVRWDDGEISDAADVECHAAQFFVAPEEVIDVGD